MTTMQKPKSGSDPDFFDALEARPLEEREAVFESFFRGRAKAGGRVEGSGLGLAIAREFAEAHGGRIGLVGGGPGGHFRVTLPKRPEPLVLQEAA